MLLFIIYLYISLYVVFLLIIRHATKRELYDAK